MQNILRKLRSKGNSCVYPCVSACQTQRAHRHHRQSTARREWMVRALLAHVESKTLQNSS